MEKYRPSTSSEGDDFMNKFCANCIHEEYLHTMDDESKMCEILTATMIFDVNSSSYPVEWIYDENNNPKCTKFQKR